jgi:hypothetical protein
MGLFNKSKPNENYLGLRQQVLNLKPSDIGVTLDNEQQVYAAVVDMPINKNIASLICVFDGTVSLYYSNGGGMIGLGQKFDEVRKAGGSFLFSARQVLSKFDKVNKFPLPDGNKANVYLLTMNFIYKTSFDMSKVDSCSKEVSFINFLIQNVINKIRECSDTIKQA